MHPNAESDSTVCIPPWSQAPRCASCREVRLRGVHHTADMKQSIKKLCGVHPSPESSSAVCITPWSQVAQFFKKLSGVLHTAETSFADCIIPWSQAKRCASCRRVKLRGVHHTTESSSAVCITPWSQTAHPGVKIENFAGLWLLLKGQSGEILL